MRSGIGFAALALVALTHGQAPTGSTPWWAPGSTATLPAAIEYVNAQGRLGLIDAAGSAETAGHAFFEPIGTNGRACVTHHQPADAMSLSLQTIRERWDATGGSDPLFAAFDGRIRTEFSTDPAPADGIDDWQSRSVEIVVEP